MKFSQGYEKIKTCFDELEVLLCEGSEKERLGNWIDGNPITPTNQYRYKLVESFTK